MKKYYNFFDPAVKDFVTTDLIKEDIEQTYLDKLNKIKQDDPYYEAKKIAIDDERLCDLDALETFTAKKKRNKRENNLVEYDNYKEAIASNNKIKSVIEFDNEQPISIRSLAIETKNTVKITTRFTKGTMLMFAKTSIKSFSYDVTDVFMFPNSKIQEIYNQYRIKKCLLLQNLTDTDSTSLTFFFYMFL